VGDFVVGVFSFSFCNFKNKRTINERKKRVFDSKFKAEREIEEEGKIKEGRKREEQKEKNAKVFLKRNKKSAEQLGTIIAEETE
jgi:hypothetical protein